MDSQELRAQARELEAQADAMEREEAQAEIQECKDRISVLERNIESIEDFQNAAYNMELDAVDNESWKAQATNAALNAEEVILALRDEIDELENQIQDLMV